MHDYYALSFKTVVFKDSCKTLCCRFLSLRLRTDRIKRRERQWPRGHPWRCPKLIRRGKHCAYSYMSVSPCFQSFTHRSRYLAFLVVSAIASCPSSCALIRAFSQPRGPSRPHSVRSVIIHHAGALSARLCAIVRCCGIIFVRFFVLRMILVFSKPELSTRVSPPRRPMRPRSAHNMNLQL